MVEDVLPIFPLPDVVFFPGQTLPLHVFEPRYRMLVEEALAGPQRIGMVLLRPGWEGDYEGTPPTHRVGSHGRIDRLERLPGGRFNLVLEEAQRFEILDFVRQAPYRAARVRALPEGPPPPPAAQREQLERLVRMYAALARVRDEDPAPHFFPGLPAGFEQQVNSLAMCLRVDPEHRQILLEAPDAGARATLLEGLLAGQAERLQAQKRFEDLDPRSRPSH